MERKDGKGAIVSHLCDAMVHLQKALDAIESFGELNESIHPKITAMNVGTHKMYQDIEMLIEDLLDQAAEYSAYYDFMDCERPQHLGANLVDDILAEKTEWLEKVLGNVRGRRNQPQAVRMKI